MAIHWRLVIPWLSRAWPVLSLIPIGAVHALALMAFPDYYAIVNKVIGMVLQISGALLVLISINDNLGMFRSQSLWSAIFGWLRAFPFVRPPIVVSATGVGSFSVGGSAKVSTNQHPASLEERIEQLEHHLLELRKDFDEGLALIRKTMNDAEARLQQQITQSSTTIAELSKRIEHATVGGFKVQALGVLMALYGAVTSVFA